MQALVLCPNCGADNRVDAARASTQEPVCGRCKKALDVRTPGHPIVANDDTFDRDVLKSGVPTLVDFWAEWCGPCRAFKPTLSSFAQATAGRLRVVQINVDESPQTARQYRIQSIPTLVLFDGGREKARVSGALPLDRLEAFVAQNS